MNWNDLYSRKHRIEQVIQQDIFANWSVIIEQAKTPETIRRMLPENIAFHLLYEFDDETTVSDHRIAIDVFSRSDREYPVIGTMDAAADPRYRHLYEKYDWRTIVYWMINITQPAIPGGSDDARPARDTMMFRVPGIFVSREPEAMDATGFEDAVLRLQVVLSAMLLRIGLTLFSTRSMRLWESIPGAMLMISKESIYQVNDIARQWFHLDMTGKRQLEIESSLPAALVAWIRKVIGDDGVYSSKTGSTHMWIDVEHDRKIRVQTGLRPFRPWDHIRTTSRMSTGFDGIDVEEVNRRIHLLLLRETTAEWEAEVLQNEINLAKHMQQSLLPPALPDSPVFEIAAFCRPARHIGGDLYDVRELENGRIAAIIGDAAGHGVDSALLAALVSGAFRASIQQHTEPEEILRIIDRVLRSTGQSGFVTLIYLLLDPDSHRIEYGLAGHYPPAHYRGATRQCEWRDAASLPLGVHLPPHYDTGVLNVAPGDTVAAFSDGLLELLHGTGQPFQNTLTNILMHHGNASAGVILDTVFKSAKTDTVSEKQTDDMTAVIIRVLE